MTPAGEVAWRTIRISQEVWDAIAAGGKFGETPDHVLRRVLGLAPRAKPRTLSTRVIDTIVSRITEVAHPEKIILFGSAARGELGPHSDIDLLVVKGGDYHRRRLAVAIRRNLRDIEAAFDILVVTPEDLKRYGSRFAFVYHPALREGRVIYESRPAA